MLIKLVAGLEAVLFGHRIKFLVLMAGLTAVMGFYASQLRLSAGFEKQLPAGHEYIRTFNQYRDQLFGANRLTIAVHARNGDIWNEAQLTRLLKVTEAVTYLPGVDRMSVKSLWTPNVFFTEITEEGFKAAPVTGGDVVPEKLTPEVIAQVRGRTVAGGHVGSLVARDQTSAVVTAELVDVDPRTGKKLDYVELNHLLEQKIRKPFEGWQHRD